MSTIRIGLDDANEIAAPREQKPRHSWTPHSLIDLAQNPPAPPTIGNLLYPGKRTLLSGETESLKTWLALILAKAEMNAGIPVAWVDLDDMGAGAILHRLRTLQITDQQINDLFLYYTPDQRLTTAKTEQKSEILQDVLQGLLVTGTRLMVIDAFTPILHLHGLDPNNNMDIETFWTEIADPIAKTGTCPCVIDHVVKNSESRGRYSTGSERKASGATVHIGASILVPFGIGRTGRSLITIHKDRPGYLPRPTLGSLELASDGEHITYTLQPDKSHGPDGFRPTILMERISRSLEQLNEPVSGNWIETNVGGNKKAIRTGLELLTNEGHVDRNSGPRNSHLYTTLKPYREDDEPTPHDLVPTAPNLAQISLVSSTSMTSSTSSYPTGEDEVSEHYGRMDEVKDEVTQNGASANPPEDLFADSQPDPDEHDEATW